MKTAAFITLGCKVNQYDSQALKEQLLAAGYWEAQPEDRADVYVVNTCTVTETAAVKSRKAIQSLHQRNPESRILVTGCYAESHAEEAGRLPGVVIAAGNAEKAGLIAGFLSGEPAVEPDIFSLSISRFDGHARAFLKVEDGCDLNCTFCIIPRVRGAVRSRRIVDAIEEAKRLVDHGHREIVLTGVHLGGFGRGGEPGETLPKLLESLAAVPGLRRLRLSSIEIQEVDDALLDVMRGHDVMCPHWHLPLQSGDDEILRRMGRRYRRRDIDAVLAAIHERWNRPALTTDIIAGFPGETEAHWRNTLAVCREAGFMKIHAFPYSDRAGTPARGFDGHLPAPVIEGRRRDLLNLERELAAAYKRRFLGEVVHPLLEKSRDTATGLLVGMTERYVRVLVDGPDAWQNEIRPVRVDRMTCDVMIDERAELAPAAMENAS